MNNSEAARIISVLRTVFADQAVSSELATAWAMVFDDVPYEPVMLAVQEYMKSDKPFFPKPGEIRTILIEHFMSLPSAEEAWSQVMWAIKEHGSYRSPVFSCQAIADAVDAIGWRFICMSENISVERAHFFRTYEAYRDRAVKHVNVPALVSGKYQELDASNPVNHVVPTPITAKDGMPF
jgi:hypothetical protein